MRIVPKFSQAAPVSSVLALVACQVNRSSIADTYTDVVGGVFAETANQTRLTLGARTRIFTMKISGHVNATTGSFRQYNITDAGALGTTKTTTSVTEVSLSASTSTLDTNASDVVTIQVSNNTAGNTVTIDSGGMMDSDLQDTFTATGVKPVKSFAGGLVSSVSFVLLEALSTSTYTARMAYAAGEGGTPLAANLRQAVTQQDASRTTFGSVFSFTPAVGLVADVGTLEALAEGPGLYYNVSAVANATNGINIGVALGLSGIKTA